jgi:hypothetical protein
MPTLDLRPPPDEMLCSTSVSVQLPQVKDLEMQIVVHLLAKNTAVHPPPVKVCVRMPRQVSLVPWPLLLVETRHCASEGYSR